MAVNAKIACYAKAIFFCTYRRNVSHLEDDRDQADRAVKNKLHWKGPNTDPEPLINDGVAGLRPLHN